jgi:hypothetical protein
VEAIAATDYMQPMVGQRTPKAELSYTQDTQGDRLMVLEDVAAVSCLEDSTAARHVERPSTGSPQYSFVREPTMDWPAGVSQSYTSQLFVK